VVNRGRIAQIGPVAEVMNRPADEFVAGFVGVETVLPGRVVRTSGGVITASIAEDREIEAVGQVEVGTEVLCCIRPESVTLSIPPALSGTSARNVFSAAIRQMTPLGLFHRVRLDCGFDLVAYVTGQSLTELDLREGMPVVASFKATAVHVIPRREMTLT